MLYITDHIVQLEMTIYYNNFSVYRLHTTWFMDICKILHLLQDFQTAHIPLSCCLRLMARCSHDKCQLHELTVFEHI